jgi:DNA-3-methyladenine glycosylase II
MLNLVARYLLEMPVTRSSSGRSASTASRAAPSTLSQAKRKAPATKTKTTSKKPRVEASDTLVPSPSLNIPAAVDSSTPENFVPAVLSFSFEDAKEHLTSVDERFEDLFNKMQCKPYEHLEQVHPFR